MSAREVFDLDFGSLWYRPNVADDKHRRPYHRMVWGRKDYAPMRSVMFACGRGIPEGPQWAEVDYGQFLHRGDKCKGCRAAWRSKDVDKKLKSAFWREYYERMDRQHYDR